MQSPSQVRREERRREARKLKIAEQVVEVFPSATPQQAAEKTAVNAVPQQESSISEFKCEQCDYKSTSERGLKQHARIKHRISQVVADDRVAEEPTPSPQLPSPLSPPPPSRLSPSAPVILKKPVKMLNGDPVSVKKK